MGGPSREHVPVYSCDHYLEAFYKRGLVTPLFISKHFITVERKHRQRKKNEEKSYERIVHKGISIYCLAAGEGQ